MASICDRTAAAIRAADGEGPRFSVARGIRGASTAFADDAAGALAGDAASASANVVRMFEGWAVISGLRLNFAKT
eukprot:790636-Pyramimonas_sp.AAC.1